MLTLILLRISSDRISRASERSKVAKGSVERNLPVDTVLCLLFTRLSRSTPLLHRDCLAALGFHPLEESGGTVRVRHW